MPSLGHNTLSRLDPTEVLDKFKWTGSMPEGQRDVQDIEPDEGKQ